MKYEYVLFDLDGTITDSGDGITRSVQYSLKRFGIEVDALSSLQKFIGPPLKDSFKKYYGFDEKESLKAIGYYREYFEKKGIFQNRVYENVEGMLHKLKESGRKLIIATSKPTVYAINIIEHFNLKRYFEDVVGSNLDGTRSTKGEVIGYIMNKYSINRPKEAVMVGDREQDVIGSRENDIDSIGVSYGYGSIMELKNAKPTYIVNNIMDIFYEITNK